MGIPSVAEGNHFTAPAVARILVIGFPCVERCRVPTGYENLTPFRSAGPRGVQKTATKQHTLLFHGSAVREKLFLNPLFTAQQRARAATEHGVPRRGKRMKS